MADKEKSLLLKANFQDNASSEISKLGKNTDAVSVSMSKGFKAAAIAAAAVTAAVTAASIAIAKMGERAGALQEVTAGFERNFGKQADALKKLQDASGGMIDNYNLMRVASKAANTGVTKDVTKLAGVMTTVQFKADEMGIGFEEMFESMVQAIARGSDMMLTKLGVVIPESLTKSMEKMTETQKTAALMNYVIKEGAKVAGEYGTATVSISDKLDALKASFVNLKDGALVQMTPMLDTIITGFTNWLGMIETAFAPGIKVLSDTLGAKGGLLEAITKLFNPTDEAKRKTQDLTQQGFSAVVTTLTEKGGLIESLTNLLTMFNNMSTTNAQGQISPLVTVFQTLAGAINLVVQGLQVLTAWGIMVKGATAGGVEQLAITSSTKTNLMTPVAAPSLKAPVIGSNSTPAAGGFTTATQKYFGSNATGGMASGWTQVGENGAEMVKLPSGSHVYNNQDSQKMGNGGITININAPTYGINDLKSSILEAVNEATARQNRLANYNLL